MKYAIKYRSDFRDFENVDEVIFPYIKGSENIVEFIPKKLKKQEQRAIIDISSLTIKIEDVMPYLNKLKEVHPNFVVQISYPEQKDVIRFLQDNEIKFMFINFVNNYDLLYTLMKYNPTDIYIVEGLCFDLVNLQVIRNAGTQLRCFPDITQCARWTSAEISEMQKFWIRPEDTEIYEEFIDVFEIFHTDDRQSVVYEIYKQRQWEGNLNMLLICSSELDIENTAIDPHFGPKRVNCKRRCMLGKCDYCSEVEKFAKEFDKTGFAIVKDKFKERYDISPQEAEKILEELRNRTNGSGTD